MTEGRNEKLSNKGIWPQWIAGFEVLFLVTQMGSITGWSSPHIPHLTSPNFSFHVTTSEISWVVSLMNVGRPFGAIAGALCVHYFGSKTAVLAGCIPTFFHWLFIFLATNVEWLYAARFLGGFSVGMMYGCYSVFLGEIGKPSIRGALIGLGTAGLPIGNVIISILGAYVPMHISALVGLAASVVIMILFILLPESPHHLVKKNLNEKAKASLRWYYGKYDVDSEFIGLQNFVENLKKQTFAKILKELKTSAFSKSLFILTVLITYSQWAGINTVLFYMEPILIAGKVKVLMPADVVIIVMVFGVVGSCLSTFLMDKCGRRILMITSCAIVALALGLLTVEFQLLDFGFDPKAVEDIAIVAMILLYMAIFTGAVPVPCTMLGEIFPPHLKSIAACYISVIAGVMSIVCSSTYNPLLNVMTEDYLFLFYALVMITAIPFTIFFVPETKGLTLQEIQNQLTGKKKSPTEPTYVNNGRGLQEKTASPFTISYSN